MMHKFATAAFCAAILAPALAPCQAGAQHAAIQSSLGCVNTVVTASHAPTGPSMADGGEIAFAGNLTPGRGTIRSVYIPPDNTRSPVASTHDRVRVCLLSIPSKGEGCDPGRDPRGREFLVINLEPERDYDAAVYSSGEHACGGTKSTPL